MHGVGNGANVVVGQYQAARGFHMRSEHHIGLLFEDGRHHFGDRRRHPGRLRAIADTAGFQHGGLGGDPAHVENLRPAVAEPAVADDQHLLVTGKLARHGFHAEGAATRHQHDRLGVIHLFQNA